jgi:hypothetical protein
MAGNRRDAASVSSGKDTMALSVERRLKKLSKEIPDDGIIRLTIQDLSREDSTYADHAIALIGASHLEKALEIGIRSRFISLTDDDAARLFEYDHRGPLADFSARIKIAHALGFIGPKTKADMDTIRVIRNAFAHASQLLHFSVPEIEALCDSLHTPDTVSILGRVALGQKERWRYIEATLTISQRIKDAVAAPPGNALSSAYSIYQWQKALLLA